MGNFCCVKKQSLGNEERIRLLSCAPRGDELRALKTKAYDDGLIYLVVGSSWKLVEVKAQPQKVFFLFLHGQERRVFQTPNRRGVYDALKLFY
jgi:hypothetical protein